MSFALMEKMIFFINLELFYIKYKRKIQDNLIEARVQEYKRNTQESDKGWSFETIKQIKYETWE